MREADERRSDGQHDVAALVDAAQDGQGAQRTQFSAQGPLPAVAGDAEAHGPTASDLAYGAHDAAFAPQRHDDISKDELKSTPQLLIDFGAKFPEAEKLIKASPPAMKFVREAWLAGARFGGYSETDGPRPDASAYTVTTDRMVYIPKTHGDNMHSMADFLFELNNAMRGPQFHALHVEADKGAKGTLTRDSYARKTVEIEVDGMLTLGEVWLDMKKAAGKENDKTWGAEDHHFYVQQYNAYKAGTKTKDQITTDVLHSRYSEGADKGKTVEEKYQEQYDDRAARGVQ